MTRDVARTSDPPLDVGEVMPTGVVTCRPGETLGELEGLISLADIARRAPRWGPAGSTASSLAEQGVETYADTSKAPG